MSRSHRIDIANELQHVTQRGLERFPRDFAFPLTAEECAELKSHIRRTGILECADDVFDLLNNQNRPFIPQETRRAALAAVP